MLDNGIFAHSQFAESAMGPQGPRSGVENQHFQVAGLMRKKLDSNAEYQEQIDALFTVGRLIREEVFEAVSYEELWFESFNRTIGELSVDALGGCRIRQCPSALMRSKFRTGDLFDFVRKGGKKDRKRRADTGLSQIDFMEWLCALSEPHIAAILSCSDMLGLTDFEKCSLRNIVCFQRLCAVSRSPENYPDMFHLWTAQRNHIDVFLTLEVTLRNISTHINHAKIREIEYQTRVLRPLEFLQLMEITQPDPVPIEPGRFYTLLEIWRDPRFLSH